MKAGARTLAEVAAAVAIVAGFMVWYCGISRSALVGLVGRARAVACDPDYDVVSLGWGPASRVHDVSDTGLVVGIGNDGARDWAALIWRDGETMRCGDRSNYQHAVDSDEDGRVVFNLAPADPSQWRAFVGLPGRTARPLGVPEPGCRCQARGMNRSGTVVGMVMHPGEAARACVWDAAGSVTVLDAPPSRAIGISDAGTIVGYFTEPSGRDVVRLWLPEGEGWRSVDLTADIPAGARPYAISSNGVVVGAIGKSVPFRWASGSGLHRLPVPDDQPGIAWGVNSRGEAVGHRGSDGGGRALLWRDDAVIDLNSRIDALSGWHLQQATAINDAGIIACVGIRDEMFEAVLLIPREAAPQGQGLSGPGHEPLQGGDGAPSARSSPTPADRG